MSDMLQKVMYPVTIDMGPDVFVASISGRPQLSPRTAYAQGDYCGTHASQWALSHSRL